MTKAIIQYKQSNLLNFHRCFGLLWGVSTAKTVQWALFDLNAVLSPDRRAADSDERRTGGHPPLGHSNEWSEASFYLEGISQPSPAPPLSSVGLAALRAPGSRDRPVTAP